MYYSASAFYEYLKNYDPDRRRIVLRDFGEPALTKRAVRRIHKRAMNAVLNRNSYGEFEKNGEYYEFGVWKWYRPWLVVPALKEFQAPAGDFGVGIEIELGFHTRQDAVDMAHAVRNWRHITLDFEGGDHPIEATFPPSLYSRFGARSQACRYLKLAKEMGGVYQHQRRDFVGTHVNVSVGGRGHSDKRSRRDQVNNIIEYGHEGFGPALQSKYFGRHPYGGIRNAGTHYECKMFNSVTDWKVLRRYVDISVELVKLIESNEVINLASVVAACERGYTLR